MSKGFDQIVVGAGVEPLDDVPLGAARREHEHGDRVPGRAQPAADLQTVHPRQVKVQDDAVLLPTQHAIQPFGPVETHRGGVVLQFEVPPDVVGQGPVVFDDEDLHVASRPCPGSAQEPTIPESRRARVPLSYDWPPSGIVVNLCEHRAAPGRRSRFAQVHRGTNVSLKYKVFLHSYLGFNSNSTLVYGEKDAILIDASQCLSDSHKMVAEIILCGRTSPTSTCRTSTRITTSGWRCSRPPSRNAKVVGLPTAVKDIVFTSSDKVDMWAIDRFGPDIPAKTYIPMPMHEPRLELEGEEILFYDDLEGDSIDNSIVWIPSLKVVCATDVAFHDCHLWPIESNVERRVQVAQGHRRHDGLRPAHRHPRPLRRGQDQDPRGGPGGHVAHLHRLRGLVHRLPGQVRRGLPQRPRPAPRWWT